MEKIEKTKKTKYYVYETGEGLAGISTKEQEGLEDNLICIKYTYEDAYNEMLNYIAQANKYRNFKI